jgi:hypothetical protein
MSEQPLQEADCEFAPGMVFRNIHMRAYTLTLVRPSGRPGFWLVEPAPGQSHGQYVYSEDGLREHFMRETP